MHVDVMEFVKPHKFLQILQIFRNIEFDVFYAIFLIFLKNFPLP